MPALNKWERRRIIAWDGEGANVRVDDLSSDTGYRFDHIYNLLANSNGNRLINTEGLSTGQVFDFFLANNDPGAINVIYGGSYDINMILKDVPIHNLASLWVNGKTWWEDYAISYAHRKRFSLKLRSNPKCEPFILWDVLGFYQKTFVGACRKWLGELPILDEIEQMKYHRADFVPEELDNIIKYNETECKLLVLLVEHLFDALDTARIKLKRYDGAGAIAAALFQLNEIRHHMGDMPQGVKDYAQVAYSGGRIEACKLGNKIGYAIHRYDINSAYPSAATCLPSYAGATWEVSTTWNKSPHSLVWIKFEHEKAPFYPLYFREMDGSILYPQAGEGIYHGCEILPLDPQTYNIVSAWNVELANDHKPFGFNQGVYRQRQIFREQGNMAEEALKLGMNSEYGKLAQQTGYRDGRIPPYHHLHWAGEITARTRATLYALAMQNPDSVIAFATDAIITDAAFTSVVDSKSLGGWSVEEFDGITIIQPGVYFLRQDGEWLDKYRGFDKGAIDREAVVQCWKEGKEEYEALLTRFVTIGSALMSNDFYLQWRHWITAPRKLCITPTGKRTAGRRRAYHRGLCPTVAAVGNPDCMSAPYPLAWVEGKMPLDRYDSDGIDIRIYQEELLDSFA